MDAYVVGSEGREKVSKREKRAQISKSGKWGKVKFCDISARWFLILNSSHHIL